MAFIGVNEHHRQSHTRTSGLAHFEGHEHELVEMVEAAMAAGSFTSRMTDKGNETRCVRLPDPSGFLCGVVRVEEGDTMYARPARPGEPYMMPRKARRRAVEDKAPAVVVDVYLYSWQALAENDERSTTAEWEIVGMSARPYEGDEPPLPITMARNILGLPGGTETSYTPEEIAHAILHWSQHVLLD